jgi:hypothetical protein
MVVVIFHIKIKFKIVILIRSVKVISKIKRNSKKRKIKKANCCLRKTMKVILTVLTLWTKYTVKIELTLVLEATPQVVINLKC